MPEPFGKDRPDLKLRGMNYDYPWIFFEKEKKNQCELFLEFVIQILCGVENLLASENSWNIDTYGIFEGLGISNKPWKFLFFFHRKIAEDWYLWNNFISMHNILNLYLIDKLRVSNQTKRLR